MQITPPSLLPTPILSPTSTGPEKIGTPIQQAQDKLTAAPPSQPAVPTTEIDTTDSVSISTEAQEGAMNNMPSPIYAEIWKGMIKVAQIDIHGHVSSFSGLVQSSSGGIAGPILAAQRAVQVAQQVGGEIRAGGLPLDSQTLIMRARLAKTYIN